MKPRTSTPILLALILAFAAVPMAADSTATPMSADMDPTLCHVCRVHDGEDRVEEVVATAMFQGEIHGFCSVGCRDKFVESPVPYLPPVLPRPAPSFTALGTDGEAFSSESLRGQWTLLDFWATWCPPCVEDLPELTALHQRYAERGFAVVGISIDEDPKAAKKVERMMKRRKASHPVYLDSETAPGWVAYNVRSVPAQFLVSPEGQIVAQWSGAIDLEVVESEIVRVLGVAVD